jgi:hypothetical protein
LKAWCGVGEAADFAKCTGDVTKRGSNASESLSQVRDVCDLCFEDKKFNMSGILPSPCVDTPFAIFSFPKSNLPACWGVWGILIGGVAVLTFGRGYRRYLACLSPAGFASRSAGAGAAIAEQCQFDRRTSFPISPLYATHAVSSLRRSVRSYMLSRISVAVPQIRS